MGALILEGGTFRPIFSSGVMDALLDYEVDFPYVIGVSAGITDGFSYVSKQTSSQINCDHLNNYVFQHNAYHVDDSLKYHNYV